MGRRGHRIRHSVSGGPKNTEGRSPRVEVPKSTWKHEDEKQHRLMKVQRSQCQQPWQRIKKPKLNKGAWSKEEDEKVKELIKKYGVKHWALTAKHMRSRNGKQCRERWNNHLNPTINKSTWTLEEDRVILQAHRQIGNRWATISKLLPGRSDNAIKNRWNSTLRRRLEKNNYLEGNSCLSFNIQTPPDHREKSRTLIKDGPPMPTPLKNHSDEESAGCSSWMMNTITEEWGIDLSTQLSDDSFEIQGASMLVHPDLSQELDISVQQPFVEESCSKSYFCVDSCSVPGFENFRCCMFDKQVDLWWRQMYSNVPETPTRILDSPSFLITHDTLQGHGLSPSEFLNVGDVEDPMLQHSALPSTPVSSSQQGDRCLSFNVITPPEFKKKMRELMEAGPQTPSPLKSHSQGESGFLMELLLTAMEAAETDPVVISQ